MKISVNPEHLQAYKTKLLVERVVDEHLARKGYLRIDAPILSPVLIPESYLEIFKTKFQYLQKSELLYLTPSPELFMKRLIAQGIGNVFYLGKSFRNSESMSSLHSHEFTMLELYKVSTNYMDIADEVLRLLQKIARQFQGNGEIAYQGKRVCFEKWEYISVGEAFSRYADIPADIVFKAEAFIKRAQEKGYSTEGYIYEDIFSQIYAQKVEPKLGVNGYPTLIYDYPKELAALAKLKDDNETAERFEFYIGGVELGDCYTELTDWKEQRDRFQKEEKNRRGQKKQAHAIDKEYIKVLQYGLVPCAGIAIGIDRLAMIFANVASIHELRLVDVL